MRDSEAEAMRQESAKNESSVSQREEIKIERREVVGKGSS